MKKSIVIVAVVFLLAGGIGFAQSSEEITDGEYTGSFSASINQDNVVTCKWDAYTGKDFKYYKLLRNSFPDAHYPDDGYLKAIHDLSVDEYTDKENPLEEGESIYYRLCVVKNNNEKLYSKSIEMSGDQVEPIEPEEYIYTQADLDAAKEESYKNGFEEGKKEGCLECGDGECPPVTGGCVEIYPDLGIFVPCATFGDLSLSFRLKKVTNPENPFAFSWELDVNSIKTK
ncbi:MAG: hypothetical protein B6I31_01220 [Desulfobacteraceae bacterium 4572_19]|nr:MAG: hypothetical protein B6I31_01220 [Desulfobacteraceae bacterium 4572_19]